MKAIVEEIPAESLKMAEYNPRIIKDERFRQLKKNIEKDPEFFFQRPCLVNRRDGKLVIYAGNQRFRAAVDLGWRFIPCLVSEIPLELERERNIKDNRQEGEWDWTSMSQNFQMGELKEWGFSENDLQKAFDAGKQIVEDEIPEAPEVPDSKRGEIYELGPHRLMCGDATNAEDVKKLMNGEKAVLLATDPPYGDSWVQKARDMQAHGYGHSRAVLHGSIQSDDLEEKELYEFILSFLKTARLAGSAPFPAYVWHRAKRIIFENAMTEAGYLVHQPIVWVKRSFVIGRLHYHPRCEWALHGWLRGSGECPFYGQRNQSDVWEINRENDKIHPTQKPVEIFAIPIRNHTLTNEICYEPFAGSGTQFIAAEQLGRRCFGMEIDPLYCDVIRRRYEALKKKT